MIIKGIGASDGYSIAKAYKFAHAEVTVSRQMIADVEAEIVKFENAVEASKLQLTEIMEKTRINLDEEHAAIFEAHILILTDPELTGGAIDKIRSEGVNADFAFAEVSNTFVAMFEAMEDDYFRERAADMKDVSKRVLYNIQGIAIQDPTQIKEEVIVVANDLTPSDTALLDKRFVKGFVTDVGGRTSHSAIMARTLEIPAVVGAKNAFDQIEDGELLILDGVKGEVLTGADEATVSAYQTKQKEYLAQKEMLKAYKDKATMTADNQHVELAANIGSPEDADGAVNNGAEAVGLYRTEFLYMGNTHFPTEEEQLAAYRAVLEKMGEKGVVVRTLDIGGDKELSYYELPKEMNPFLGNRAVRLCLNEPDIFKTQLRALLRASVYGNLKIMFPMIATLDEFRKAKAVLMEVKTELEAEGQEIGKFELGIMIEIPAAAVLAKAFAKEVDFFSIGTNDLIQYSFAADRMNEKVSYLYQPYHPALLHLIKGVIEASHAEGKWTGMCGEMAGELMAAPLLLGLGLDEFSMSASSILKIRHFMAGVTKEECQALVEKALLCGTEQEVIALVEEFLAK
ncbi:phosphoenolpyruvate--protein phosphotransferase [Clostridiales bacterium COT073_COT-073]|nr:phosphoenolpyruvate--protein phosphotransferase [Clostridiales bacterium COT073_COT-073]